MPEIYQYMVHTRPVKTGEIAAHVYAVKTDMVNFFVYRNGQDTICIDSGFGKRTITRELNRLGIAPGSVTHLFLTHSDFDHSNGLALFEKAQIYLSADEEQIISGKIPRLYGFIYNSRLKKPYHPLHDNDMVTAGSIKVRAIATPGHTPGSMSYLVNDSVLLVGDTFKLVNNKVYPLRRYNMDTEQQKESIRKLAGLVNVRLACTAHSGYTEEYSEAISCWK
jgi:Zn-dependent hydrolases, including glyoxylases